MTILTPKNIRTAYNLGRVLKKSVNKSRRGGIPTPPSRGKTYAAYAKTHDHADDQIHSGVDHQRHHVVLKPKSKKIATKSQNVYYNWDYNFTMVGNWGSIAWNEGLYLDHAPQWLFSTNSRSPGACAVALFDLNYNRNLSGSALYTPSTVPSADQYCLESTRTIIDMTSVATYSQIVKIHVMCAKQNSGDACLHQWAIQQGNHSLGLSAFAFPTNTTTITQSGAGGYVEGSATPQVYGNSSFGLNPLQNSDVRKFWKNMKTITVYLAPGASERVELKIDHNSVRSRGQLSNLVNDGTSYVKGQITLLYETVGMPVISKDTNNDGSPIHGKADVLISQHVKGLFKQVKEQQQRISTMFVSQGEPVGKTNQPKIITAADLLQDVVTGN